MAEFALTDIRAHLTHLERLLKPGQTAIIRKRGRPYAEIRLVPHSPEDPYERIARTVAGLGRAKGRRKNIAGRVDELLYGPRRKRR